MTLHQYLHALAGAFVNGAVAAISTSVVDSSFSIYTHKFWEVALASGVMGAVLYIKQFPVTEITTSESVTLTTKTVVTPQPDAKTSPSALPPAAS